MPLRTNPYYKYPYTNVPALVYPSRVDLPDGDPSPSGDRVSITLCMTPTEALEISSALQEGLTTIYADRWQELMDVWNYARQHPGNPTWNELCPPDPNRTNDAPFWDDADDVDGGDNPSAWEYVGDWLVSAFLATTVSPAAAIFYKANADNIRLSFKRDGLGGVARVLIEDIVVDTIDTFLPGASDILDWDFDVRAFLQSEGLGGLADYALEIVFDGASEAAFVNVDGFSALSQSGNTHLSVVRKYLPLRDDMRNCCNTTITTYETDIVLQSIGTQISQWNAEYQSGPTAYLQPTGDTDQADTQTALCYAYNALVRGIAETVASNPQTDDEFLERAARALDDKLSGLTFGLTSYITQPLLGAIYEGGYTSEQRVAAADDAAVAEVLCYLYNRSVPPQWDQGVTQLMFRTRPQNFDGSPNATILMQIIARAMVSFDVYLGWSQNYIHLYEVNAQPGGELFGNDCLNCTDAAWCKSYGVFGDPWPTANLSYKFGCGQLIGDAIEISGCCGGSNPNCTTPTTHRMWIVVDTPAPAVVKEFRVRASGTAADGSPGRLYVYVRPESTALQLIYNQPLPIGETDVCVPVNTTIDRYEIRIEGTLSPNLGQAAGRLSKLEIHGSGSNPFTSTAPCNINCP